MRAFVAVNLSPELRERVGAVQHKLRDAIERDAGRRFRITWTQPQTLHLTLKFLGEITEAASERLLSRIEPAIRHYDPVAIPLVRIGVFPRPQAPRIFWLGPSPDWIERSDAKKLIALAAAIDDICTEIGVPRDEHPWRPHLTLARVREGERDVGRIAVADGILNRPIDVGSLEVTEIALMKSELRPTGSVHTQLWTVPL